MARYPVQRQRLPERKRHGLHFRPGRNRGREARRPQPRNRAYSTRIACRRKRRSRTEGDADHAGFQVLQRSVTDSPATWPVFSKQEFAGRGIPPEGGETNTEQVPQSPSAQPSLVPRSPSCARSQSSRIESASAFGTVRAQPFSVSGNAVMRLRSWLISCGEGVYMRPWQSSHYCPENSAAVEINTG